MASATRPRNRAKAFEALSRRAGPAEFDTEANDDGAGFSASEDDDGEYEAFASDGETGVNGDDTAREHYVDVGKSSLREKARKRAGPVALGPRYGGVKIGRKGLDEGEDDGFVDESGRSGSESEGDELAGINGVEDGDDEEGEEEDDEEDEDNLEDEDGDVEDDESELEDARPMPTSEVDPKKKAQLRDVMREERSVATALSKATRADAEKGRAVKRQRATFDSLLGARIKLQKSLIGANTLVGLEQEQGFSTEISNAVKSAEEAAFNFWTSLNDFREDVISARTGEKRKRHFFSDSTSIGKLWAHVQDQEESALAHRNSTLRKWSAKTGQANAMPRDSGLKTNRQSATIIDALQQHLTDSDRLLKRVRTPRSCAPLQLSRQIPEDSRIYDDADLYGQMLKELLERKSSNADAAPAVVDLDFKAVKTKKNVDTKASKGRKLRYTVHEKLQNLMAPEDRGTWTERQADELFGSLFGRRMALAEDDANGMDAIEEDREEHEDEEVNDADFAMFRS